jgi:hypothetical protein
MISLTSNIELSITTLVSMLESPKELYENPTALAPSQANSSSLWGAIQHPHIGPSWNQVVHRESKF